MKMRSLMTHSLIINVILATLLVVLSQYSHAAPLKNPLSSSNTTEQASTINHAEVVQSLDELIKILENNRQRQQFLVQLKDLRNTLKAEAEQKKEPEVGLLSGVSEFFNSFTTDGKSPIDFWEDRLNEAKQELDSITPSIDTLPQILFIFSLIIFLWFAVAHLILWTIRRIQIHYQLPLELEDNPTTLNVLFFALQKLIPWIAAFFFVLYYSIYFLNDSPAIGKAIALLLTYSIMGGGVFSALCFIALSLLSGEHRWGALKILRQKAFRPLFAIGAFASVGDILTHPQLVLLLKPSLSITLATINNVLAALVTGWFVISFHRPIAQLIRNRSLHYRTKRKGSYDLLRFFSIVWHVPVLMLVFASIIATILSGDTSLALRKAVSCALLLVVALVLTGLIQRYSSRLLQKIKRTPTTALYGLRLTRYIYSLITCAIWIGFVDIALRFWDSSLVIFEQGAGHQISVIVMTLIITILCTRLVWILVDTAIYRALTGIGRAGPSSRAQTMMPLIRNTAFCIIVIIATIVALANLGMNVTPLLAGAGVIGIAIGFGAQTLVSDLITGLFIIVEDSLAIGDYVDVGNHKGTVEAITIRTVTLRDIDGIVHIVPFSEIKTVKNYSRELGYAIFRISIAHDMKIDDAIKAIRNVANEMRLDPILQRSIWSPIEIQGVDSFDSGNAILRARFKTAPLKQFEISRTFNLRLKRYLDEHGLDLGVPRRSVQVINATPEIPLPIEAADS